MQKSLNRRPPRVATPVVLGISPIASSGFRVNLRRPSDAPTATQEPTDAARAASPGSRELNAEEQRELEALETRDREVRTHEEAHIAASGELSTSGPFYEYETGPDGRRYVVDGEVKIQAPRKADAEETIRVQEQLIRAALAPAEPSAQDRRVAAAARQRIAKARADISRETPRDGTRADAGRVGDEGSDERPVEAQSDAAQTLDVSEPRSRAVERYAAVAAVG